MSLASFQDSNTQFQGSGLGFWRDPMTGAFGIEAGLFSPFEGGVNYAKLGGVGEYYWGDMATISVFGGAMLPTDKTPFDGGIEEIQYRFLYWRSSDLVCQQQSGACCVWFLSAKRH
jgi:hypothetical protein